SAMKKANSAPRAPPTSPPISIRSPVRAPSSRVVLIALRIDSLCEVKNSNKSKAFQLAADRNWAPALRLRRVVFTVNAAIPAAILKLECNHWRFTPHPSVPPVTLSFDHDGQ